MKRDMLALFLCCPANPVFTTVYLCRLALWLMLNLSATMSRLRTEVIRDTNKARHAALFLCCPANPVFTTVYLCRLALWLMLNLSATMSRLRTEVIRDTNKARHACTFPVLSRQPCVHDRVPLQTCFVADAEPVSYHEPSANRSDQGISGTQIKRDMLHFSCAVPPTLCSRPCTFTDLLCG